MTYTVFVYGSLMRDFGNHRLLKDSVFIGEAHMQGLELYSLGGFPGAVDGDGSIYGEMYEVDEPTLARLDMLEGHPTFYERQEREAFNEYMNASLPCFFYNYQGDVSRLEHIPSGSWRNYNATETHPA